MATSTFRSARQSSIVDIAGIEPLEAPPAGWIGTAEAAARWEVSPSAIRNCCAEGLLDAVLIGRRWWIAPEASAPSSARTPVGGPGVPIDRAAATLGTPFTALRRAVAAGEVPSVLLTPGGRRVVLADLEAWMESKRAVR